MGAVIAKRLSLNRTKGPIFAGTYVARLAKHFEIPIWHYEKEETLLPHTFLDYKSMLEHEFIVNNDDNMLLYNLRFNKKHNEVIILPAPSLFDLTAGQYLVFPSMCMRTEARHQLQSLSRNHTGPLLSIIL